MPILQDMEFAVTGSGPLKVRTHRRLYQIMCCRNPVMGGNGKSGGSEGTGRHLVPRVHPNRPGWRGEGTALRHSGAGPYHFSHTRTQALRDLPREQGDEIFRRETFRITQDLKWSA